MSTKIDGPTDSSTISQHAPVDDTAEQADGATQTDQAAAQEEDSWSMGDAAGDFWAEVKGRAADAKDAVSGKASQAKEQVQATADGVVDSVRGTAAEALEEFDQRMGQAEEISGSIIDGGKELYDELQAKRAEFSDELDEIFDENVEAVEELAGELVDGSWSLAGDVMRAVGEVDGEWARERFDEITSLPDKVDEAKREVAYQTIKTTLEQVAAEGDNIETTCEKAAEVLDSPHVRMMSMTSPGMDMGRRVSLKLINAAKNSPEVAEALLEDPEAIRELLQRNDVDLLEGRIEALDVGESYKTSMGISGEVHAKLGGGAHVNVAGTVERVGENTYRLQVDGDVGGKAGLGASAQGEGQSADVATELSGTLVLEISGEGAAAEVARRLAGEQGNVEAIHHLDPDVETKTITATGSFSPGVEGSISGLDASLGPKAEIGMRTFDGVRHIGGEASYSLDVGYSTPYVQTPDSLADFLADDQPADNPVDDLVRQHLPVEFAEGLAEAYGPAAGVRLGASPEVSVGVFAPAEDLEPIRVDFSASTSLQVGRTELDVSYSATIEDVGGLAEALGTSTDEVLAGLRSGELTPESLRRTADDLGVSIDEYVDVAGLQVEGNVFRGVDIDVAGLAFQAGTLETATIYPPGDGSSIGQQLSDLLEMREEVDKAQAESNPNVKNKTASLSGRKV